MGWKHVDDDMWERELGDGRVLEMLVVVGEPAWWVRGPEGRRAISQRTALWMVAAPRRRQVRQKGAFENGLGSEGFGGGGVSPGGAGGSGFRS